MKMHAWTEANPGLPFAIQCGHEIDARKMSGRRARRSAARQEPHAPIAEFRVFVHGPGRAILDAAALASTSEPAGDVDEEGGKGAAPLFLAMQSAVFHVTDARF